MFADADLLPDDAVVATRRVTQSGPSRGWVRSAGFEPATGGLEVRFRWVAEHRVSAGSQRDDVEIVQSTLKILVRHDALL